MDKERRKALKAEAKHLLGAEEARRKEALAESIPVDQKDPDWGAYYRENTLRERLIQSNRSRVLSGARVGFDLLWFPMRSTPDDRDLADVDYFRCLSCSDLIPLAPRKRLRCGCGSLTHGPLALGAPVDTPQSAEMVRVLAKAPPRKWWQVWRRLGFVWL